MADVDPDSRVSGLDDIFARFNRSDAPGLVIGIAQHGKLLYRRAFGLASVELAVANTLHTRMRIGSTSKHFACFAALLLAEDGTLDIDASIRVYIPELPVLAGEPTLRQLMTHTGGYRCYLDLSVLGNVGAMMEKGDAFRYQLQQQDVNFPPGERMAYCNGGYHLLSIAIARASGMTFEAFLKQRIFEPLGMVNTDSVPGDLTVVPGRATPHVPQPDGSYRRGVLPLEDLLGEGSIVSTAADMLIWLAHLRGTKRIGSAASWAQMLSPARYSSGAVGTYCLGLERERYRGVEVIHHAGAVDGGASQMIAVPGHELDIIVITNGAPASPTELAWQVIDRLLGDEVLKAASPRVKTAGLEELIGRYWSQDTRTLVELLDDKGDLGFNLLNSIALPVVADENRYCVTFPGMGPLAFRHVQASPESDMPVIELSNCGHVDRLVRLPDVAPPVTEFASGLTGEYVSNDLAARATIGFDGSGLTLAVRGARSGWSSELKVISREVAATSATPGKLSVPAVLVVERDDTGRVHGFRLSTTRSMNLHFARTNDNATQERES
ncbi:serine hydrolase domain-containing protein [Paraburkholderia agricolaris]|uniref:serine hydrolase domain-containing protein n=1 Tax=Paraburkholderia agricolaris TaxID=2152888 RepID=UPI001290DDCE|nr:serine hydrolase domain-containing protein [Paraburkholderia agricolaris]